MKKQSHLKYVDTFSSSAFSNITKKLPRFHIEPRQPFRLVVFAGKEQLKNPEALVKS